MKEVLVQPFNNSTTSGKQLIAVLMVVQTLMACTFQMIPFIFYRPRFYCQHAEGLTVCDQLDACLETPVKFRSDYAFSSISMEFGLYCDKKKDEATILTFMMVGHIVGAVASTLLSDLGHHKRSVMKVLISNSIVSGICCLTAGLAQTPFILGLALTIWTVSSQMLQNFLNMAPTLFFSNELSKKIFSLIIISWSLYSIITPATLYLHSSWRALFVVNLAVPWFLCTAYLWYHSNEFITKQTEKSEGLQQLLTVDQRKEAISEEKEHLKVTYADLVRSSHFRNIILYFLVFGGSYVAAMTSALTLGGLSGNIYFNITIVCVAEATLSCIGGYLVGTLSIKKTLGVIYVLITISYALYSVHSDLLRSLIVIEGKILTDVSWVLLASFTIVITPPRFIPLIMSTRAIYVLVVCMVMPYTKYLMELLRLTIFVFSALYEAGSLICLQSIHEQDISVP